MQTDSSHSWPDAYRQEFTAYEKGESLYQRVDIRHVEPIDDYSFAGFLVWLDYIAMIHDVQRQTGKYAQALFKEN